MTTTKVYSYFNALANSLFFEEPTQMQIELKEQEFHNMVREYVVFLLILISLYGVSYIAIYIFRKKREEVCVPIEPFKRFSLFLKKNTLTILHQQVYANEEDALVYRISFWMCTFSLAVSIGSAFLLPFSIVTNEILLYYPQNYYMQWLNDSLIHGLWNYVFLFSNISLFVLLPFAYFFTESEGFGSSRGIMSRVNETIVLLLLLMVIILGITYLLCCTFGYSELALTNLLTIWHYLPLLYSCISFFGVIILLVCTPIGFAVLFTVLGDLIVKPQFLRDIQQEYEVALLEEMHLRKTLERKKAEQANDKKTCNCPNHCNQSSVYTTVAEQPSFFDFYKSKSLPSFTSFLSSTLSPHQSYFTVNSSSLPAADNKPSNISEIKDQLLTETINNCSFAHLNCVRRRNLLNATNSIELTEQPDGLKPLTDENKNDPKLEDYVGQLEEAELKRKKLQTLKRVSALRRNFGYPLAILLLLCFTLLSIGMVLKNILELLVGIRALPISSAAHRFTLGISSLYKLGYFGAVLEILLILYLWHTSLVGLYSLPFLQRIKPQVHNTSFTKIIVNCALLLILSSALPLLARLLGLTEFNLLGRFAQIEWLGNFFVVLFYNLLFVSFSTFTLAKKFTVLMHKELFNRLSNLWCSTSSANPAGQPAQQLPATTPAKNGSANSNSTKLVQNGSLNNSINGFDK